MIRRRDLLIGAAIASTYPVAEALRPRNRLADTLPPLNLSEVIPRDFGDWSEDRNLQPVLPDPTVQEKLDALYTQVLARSYRDKTGHLLMLCIAYGSDQASEATAVHRPEFCYSAQGFKVEDAGQAELALPDRTLPTQRLIASSGPRVEPIVYWVTLADVVTLPGFGRKLAQIRYGLRGSIPDGMLVRTSTVGVSAPESFDLQAGFLRQLERALPGGAADRVFGARQPARA